ncbi:MAG TPA: DNA helicase [Gammaproteobacteria bacterium]|nr:DNA helicase [Gammaproteobacteria bacterium]
MDAPVRLLPWAADPLADAAGLILAQYRARLPDLGDVTLLVPDTQCAPALRRTLLQQADALGFPALLGPAVRHLDDYLADRHPPPRPLLDRAAQELVLVEAVREARSLYPAADPWLLADQLLDLFEELTRSTVGIDARLQDFCARLQDAYGIGDEAPAPLGREARIVHSLWHAWRRQLDDDGCLDAASAHLQRLRDDRGRGDDELWLLGFTRFTAAEVDWLRGRLAAGRTRVLLHGSARGRGYHPDAPLTELLEALQATVESPSGDDFSRALDQVFDRDAGSLPERAARCAASCPADPFAGRLTLFAADGQEQEAQAVELQVRRWLLDGQARVGIVTGDRRLARRVRALLERAGISLEDAGGWALSTTSAAAVLERWLEALEEDFACGPLLDVLKSPFIAAGDRDRHLARVRRLEQDVILHENVARGLDRYRRALQARSERLPEGFAAGRRELETLLNQVDHAAEPLRGLLSGRHPAPRYTRALNDSLSQLGAVAGWADDAAGRALLAELETLDEAARRRPLDMAWAEFRSWLGRTLERHNFRPRGTSSPVQLLTPAQSRLQRFDALVLAGCTQAQLPGAPADGGYFNQAVRAELGLDTWRRELQLRLHDFRRLLEAAPRLLLTRTREQDGETLAPSPWLALLETFHRNAWGGDLHDRNLAALLARADSRVCIDTRPLPATTQRQPRPVLAAGRLPERWSASAHQRLVDCPYRFFAADGLALKPLDEIREALQKNDYGNLVHRILEAFHCGVGGLPGPWSEPLDGTTRQAAIELLEDISRRVFARAQQENFLARGWLRQWLEQVPAYIDWQSGRQRDWQVEACELQLERELAPGLRLKGRLDRLDRQGADRAIVDYKTGRVPDQADVDSGEAVQLPSYALLRPEATQRVEYLRLDRKGVDNKVALEGEALQRLQDQVADRLRTLVAGLSEGAALPAWGDDDTCAWCEFSGLCRRNAWHGEVPGDD